MVVEAAKVIQSRTRYQETELQWIGDFNPKMIQIAKELEFEKAEPSPFSAFYSTRIRNLSGIPYLTD